MKNLQACDSLLADLEKHWTCMQTAVINFYSFIST